MFPFHIVHSEFLNEIVIEPSCIFFQLSVGDILNISKEAEREDKRKKISSLF